MIILPHLSFALITKTWRQPFDIALAQHDNHVPGASTCFVTTNMGFDAIALSRCNTEEDRRKI